MLFEIVFVSKDACIPSVLEPEIKLPEWNKLDDQLEALCQEFDDMLEDGQIEDLFGAETADVPQADVPKPDLAETMAMDTKCEEAKCEETKFQLGLAKFEHQKEEVELQGMQAPQKKRRLPDSFFLANNEKPQGPSVPQTDEPSTPVRPPSKKKASQRTPQPSGTPTAKRTRNKLGTPPSAQSEKKNAQSSSKEKRNPRESPQEGEQKTKKSKKASQEQTASKFAASFQ